MQHPAVLHPAVLLTTPLCPRRLPAPCRRVGFSLTNVNSPGTAVAVDCSTPANQPCPAFANGYLATSRIVELTAEERASLFPTGTQAYYKLVTGTVPAAALYNVTLWGINDVTPGGVASDPSESVATVGEPGHCLQRRMAGWGQRLTAAAAPSGLLAPLLPQPAGSTA